MRKFSLISLAVLGAVIAAVTILLRARAERVEGVERIVSERPLDTMTRDELYELAREHDIPGRSKMKKSELLAALSRAGRSG
jgi:hypothetical protein